MKTLFKTMVCGAMLFAGCGAPPEGVSAKEQALTGYPFGPVSDETWKNNFVCGENNVALNQFQCRGRYCDDMYMGCGSTGPISTDITQGWNMPKLSDESGVNVRTCQSTVGGPFDGVIDGIVSVDGNWADNIIFHCSRITSGTLRDCTWTGWFSEEGSGYMSFQNKVPVAAACSGPYCDNMAFLVCTPSF